MPKDITKLKAETAAAFPDIQPNQMWPLIMMMKHVRLRCRNNSALTNFLNNMFKDYRFFMRKAMGNDRYGKPKDYDVLDFKFKGQTVVTPEEEDEE